MVDAVHVRSPGYKHVIEHVHQPGRPERRRGIRIPLLLLCNFGKERKESFRTICTGPLPKRIAQIAQAGSRKRLPDRPIRESRLRRRNIAALRTRRGVKEKSGLGVVPKRTATPLQQNKAGVSASTPGSTPMRFLLWADVATYILPK